MPSKRVPRFHLADSQETNEKRALKTLCDDARIECGNARFFSDPKPILKKQSQSVGHRLE